MRTLVRSVRNTSGDVARAMRSLEAIDAVIVAHANAMRTVRQ